MSFARRYAWFLVLPPLVLVVPLALAFIIHVTHLATWRSLVIACIVAYVIGAVLFAMLIAPAARSVEDATRTKRGVGDAASRCLARTVYAAAFLWLGVGSLMAVIGTVTYAPSFLGFQYFAEAALIVAAPAMAWCYWTSKRLLLSQSRGCFDVKYTGSVYSIGVKIAMVFIGFFIISVGALVLLVSSRVASMVATGSVPEPDVIAYEVGSYGLIIAVLTAAMFGVATYFLARDITGPMQRLIRAANEMAEGRFDREPQIFADDEVGRLASSFSVTRAHLRELISRVGNRGSAITDGVRVMREGTDALLVGAREQSGMTQQSASSLLHVRGEAQSVLGAVDTMTEAASDSAARASELRASSQEVAARMDDLFRSVEKTATGTDEITASASEMSRRTHVLSGISGDVLTFVAELDATIRTIHETANATERLANEAIANARAGRQAVDETVEGIRTAQESTQKTSGAFESLQTSLGQIGQILTFIDELTNRTNLLSFNAAIIAAQAGQNDFGFSVIADEVRQLADRTRSATKEISGIIRNVQPVAKQALGALDENVARVDRTVLLANNAAAALAAILESSERAMTTTRSMARSLDEQARATQHLHEVTAKMSEHVEEIDRSTRGQAEATRLMSEEAERVSDIAAQVKRATDEQVSTGAGIAQAMEQIAADIREIRDRLGRQLVEAEQIANASEATLTIAQKNNTIAERFSAAIEGLVATGVQFDQEVARFRL